MKNIASQVLLSAGLILSMLSFANCGGDSGENEPNTDTELLDPTLVASPCIGDDARLPLPAGASSTQDEIGLEIFAAVTAGNGLIPTFATFFFPPSHARRLPPDGVYIGEDDIAYLWEAGDDRFIYLKNDLSYSIYEANDSDRPAQEILYVEQDENCDKFNLTQYAGSGDPLEGKNIFYFFYRNAGTAQRMEYGEGVATESGTSYKIRTFEEGTGEFTKYIKNERVLFATWTASGSGTYHRYENDVETESGTWAF